MLVPETEIVISRDGVELGRTVVRPGDYIVGRDEAADIVIADELVAPRHAQLTVNYHEIFIEDLGSMTGTFVAGEIISSCTRVWPHQKMQIGSVFLETRRIRKTEIAGQSLAPETATLRRMLPEEFLRERKYEIGGIVARGGMGAILGAREATIDRKVAMKVMLTSGKESDLLRFVAEAKITGKLEHPNIVPVHELGIDEHEQVFYTMKFVEGITLKKVLELLRDGLPGTEKKYSLTTLLTVFQKICDAVAFAHSKGVIHRDLKPENIMLGAYGEVLVMDWGLAKVRFNPEPTKPAERSEEMGEEGNDTPIEVPVESTEPSPFAEQISVTMAGTVLGTPHYMSPEQARGDVESLDERTDIYALGAILYQILALRPPVAGSGKTEILENARSGRIEPLSSTAPRRHRSDPNRAIPLHHLPGGRIPASLAAVAMKALSFDASARYPAVQDLQAEITRFQSGFATTAEGAGLFKQGGLLLVRHQREAAILAASILGLCALGLAAFSHIAKERNAAHRERVRAEEQRSFAERERARAQDESERAQRALADLRSSAPAYHVQAGALLEAQRVDEALEKIDLALRLAPDDAEYHLFRAHALQAMQHLPEALESYRRALLLRPGDLPAKKNAELCERLLRENNGALPLSAALQAELLDAIVAQKRSAESVFLARALGREGEVALTIVRSRLKSLIAQEKWNDDRIRRLPDGTFFIDLSELLVPELSLLSGLPVSVLRISRCGASDLAPLSGLPLRELHLDGLPVRDLSPLKQLSLVKLSLRNTPVSDLRPISTLPLRELAISHSAVTDLTPVRGMALRTLVADGIKVRDISALRAMPLEELSLRDAAIEEISALAGMPLRSLQLGKNPFREVEVLRGAPLVEVDLSGCAELRDLTPLAGCKQLRTLLLPGHMTDLAFLRKLPALQRISTEGFEEFDFQWTNVTSAREFFARQGTRLARLAAVQPRVEALRAELRKLGLEEAAISNRVKVDPASALLDVDLAKLPLTDLKLLQGLPVRKLNIGETKVVDLGAVRGMPLSRLTAYSGVPLSDLSPLAGCATLRHLWLSDSKVQDLRPLAGLKITELHLGATQVSDLSPLRGMPLRQLTINKTPVTDVSSLLSCPALEDLTVSRTVPNLRLLQRLPKLAFLSDVWNAREARASQTAEEFWRQFAKAAPEREIENRIQSAFARVRQLPGWGSGRLEKMADGTYRVDLSKLPVTDITFLRDLRISDLDISNTNISQLAPLSRCPLRVLICYVTQVEDLAPLRGMALEKLDAGDTKASDIRALKGMPLRSLSLRTTKVADLDALEGMPLEVLNISNLTRVTSLKPLQKVPLRELYMENTGITDLRPLSECATLEKINIHKSNIADLQPLAGKKLTEIYVVNTRVRELEVLRGMPLRKVHADFTDIADISPLFDCLTLEELLLPANPREIGPLRRLPKLGLISFRRNAGGYKPGQTSEEFWKEIDAP